MKNHTTLNLNFDTRKMHGSLKLYLKRTLHYSRLHPPQPRITIRGLIEDIRKTLQTYMEEFVDGSVILYRSSTLEMMTSINNLNLDNNFGKTFLVKNRKVF